MALLGADGKELKRRFPDRPLVLLYCHPYKAHETHPLLAHNHWDYESITQLIVKRFSTPKISLFTIDPQVISETRSANIVMDGFSADFISAFQGKFDMLILPDCGGIWATVADRGETASLIAIMKQLLSILKPGGTLCVSKFIHVSIEEVAASFLSEGYRVETFENNHNVYLIVTNPPPLGGRRRTKTRRRNRK